jgi:hypothetical protein
MFKLNECGYDESLDVFTIVQLYKTYSRPALVYGIENLNLNIGETDRITNFEKQIIKKSLKFAPFHHTKLLFDALKLENMDEKLTTIKMSFHLRLLKNNYTRTFTKELIKLSNGVPDSHSIWHPLLDMVSTDRLNRYLTLKRIKDCSELVLETTKLAIEKRFRQDRDALLVRGMLHHILETRDHISEMLEPFGYRFRNETVLDKPYDNTIF